MEKNLKEMNQKKEKALNTWLTSKDGGKGYSNGELITKYEKEYLDLNNKQYELEHTEGSPQEEINKVIAQKLERRKKLHEMYAMRDFIFKPIEDNISEYQQEIMLAMQTPINQMIQLEKKYIEQQDMGNVKAAQEIRNRLESARETLYGVFETWIKAIEDSGLSPDFYANRTIPDDEILPWDVIDCGVTKDFLIKERHKAVEAVTTPSCKEKY